jgi:hypothetical protein
MSKRLLALTVMLLVFSGGSALADHTDPHPDDAQRCDTWWRADGYDGDNDHNTHEDPGTPEPTLLGPVGPDNTAVIAEGGHYVVNSNSFYVEVVGGQGYARPINPTGSRGGWVQGEVDIAGAPADVDFFSGTFLGPGGADPTYAEKDLCLNVGNMRVVNLMDCAKPPLTTSDNCPEH